MKKYKIIVAYDGTDYFGWQVQPGQKTVAGTLQETFEYVFGKEILISAASRTDAGVHGLGQVAAFSTDIAIEPEQLLNAWQNVLPESLLIRSIAPVWQDWNPRHHVKQKTYYYHFFQERPLPFIARYGWFYRYPVDIEKLKECLHVFVGTHDFRSFCTGAEYDNTVRTIDLVAIEYLHRFKAYRIIIKGPGFLRYMIRRIVGACLEVASRDTLTIDDLKKAIAEKKSHQLLPSAPAHGLWLYKIVYHDDYKGESDE
jgi:tRNA pseudouridine38-40 synthase